jgi:hypothetical protein
VETLSVREPDLSGSCRDKSRISPSRYSFWNLRTILTRAEDFCRQHLRSLQGYLFLHVFCCQLREATSVLTVSKCPVLSVGFISDKCMVTSAGA